MSNYTDGEILDAIYDFIGNGCSLTPENFEEFMATFEHETEEETND